MTLELVSDDRDYTSEASVKVSSRSNIRNPGKTPPDIKVPDDPGDGVRWELTSIRSFCESFIKIQLVLTDLEMIYS